MSSYRITIEGSGLHHNGWREDVDSLAADFVHTLVKSGHSVSRADIVLDGGGQDNLLALQDSTRALIEHVQPSASPSTSEEPKSPSEPPPVPAGEGALIKSTDDLSDADKMSLGLI